MPSNRAAIPCREPVGQQRRPCHDGSATPVAGLPPLAPLPLFDEHPAESQQSPTAAALRLFLGYRLVLVLVLGIGFFAGVGPSLLGSSFPEIFAATTIVYLGAVVSSGLFLAWRSPGPEQQVQIALFEDILAITLLMHASGGLRSGLGLLIAVSIAGGSLLTGGRLALLFAALATLAVLGEQVSAQVSGDFPVTAYTQGGLLGVTFFAVALLAHGLAVRLQETERLAHQRGLDLANLAQLNEYIIQHMATGVLVVDQSSSIRLMSDSAWHLLGRPDAGVGSTLGTRLPKLARLVETWQRDPQATPPSFRPQPGGREIKPQFAQLGPDQCSGTLIFLEDGARVMEQAQQMKLASLGRLTASIAHEIRNPLGAISHAGQLLAESPDLSRGDRRLTEIIASNSKRLNDIIETVLQLSRRARARPELVPLDLWTDQFVTELCRSRMLDRDRFRVQVEPRILVQVDTRQLTQILGNLCDNALKYAAGADGSPPLIQLRGGHLPEHPHPVLDVTDNGPGIAPEHLRQIFEPFFTTGAKGTGLGLYIAKELCEINRIDLEYLAQSEGGSCFRLGFRSWRADVS